MASSRRFYRKRVLFPKSLPNSNSEAIIVCLRDDWIRAIVEYAKNQMLWTSTYYDQLDMTGYTVPSEEEMVDIRDWAEGLIVALEEAKSMTCEDLITAISNINISVSSAGGCCGVGGMGSRPPAPSADEGSPPPDGYEEIVDENGDPSYPGDPYYQDRKCKIANAIHDTTYELIDRIHTSNIVQVLEDLGISPMEVMPLITTYIIGELATPIPILDGVMGTVVGWALNWVIQLVIGDNDLEELKNGLANNRSALVCSLYNSSNAFDGLADYLVVLGDANVSVANRSFLSWVMTYDVINLLYFWSDEAVEAALENYVGETNCALCGCQTTVGGYGQLVSNDGSTIVVDSLFQDNSNRAVVVFYGSSEPFCGNEATMEPTVVSGAVTGGSGIAWRVYSDADLNTPFYSSDVPPGELSGVRYIAITSLTSFSVSIDYSEDV